MNTAVLLAGGSGKRMAGTLPDKVLTPLCEGRSALEMCIRAFDASGCAEQIVITFRDDAQKSEIEALVKFVAPREKVIYANGGAERQDSVINALEAIHGDDGLVFIHDAARPLVTPDDILRLCESAGRHGAAVIAHPVTDTIKRVEGIGQNSPLTDVPRAELRAMETPQVFGIGTIRNAYRHVAEKGIKVTDDAAAAAVLGIHPVLVEAMHPNPKLTTPADVEWVRFLLTGDKETSAMNTNLPPYRIGFGYDIHRFVQGRRLVLGGVEIHHDKGLEGHSDADCLCHAIADAILGAAGLPDIGHYFPPGKPETKDMDSLLIVSGAVAHAAEKRLFIGNIDATLIAREPKVAPHVAAMKEKLSRALGIPADRIGIKATTNEGIDGLGKGEGVAAHAVAMLFQK